MSQPARPALNVSSFRSLLALLRRPWDWLRRIDQTEDADESQRDKLRAQVEIIRRAFDGNIAMAGGDGLEPTDEPTDTLYFYRPGAALVSIEWIEEVESYFTENARQFKTSPERVGEPVDGLLRMIFPERADGRDPVLTTLRELDARYEKDSRRRGPVATPDHLLYVTTIKAGFCPATEPMQPASDRPVPAPSDDATAGAGVHVSVVDTGLWMPATTSAATAWLRGAVADLADQEQIDPHAIGPYAAHGTFVAGVVRCRAPQAHVQVQGALTHGGAIFESEIVEQLHQALGEEDKPQLISISAGTYTRRDFALLSFEILMKRHQLDGSETLVVAAAGNDSSNKPFYPAALPGVIAVGSVDADRSVSHYSNVGPWVDVYALGANHVNAYTVGSYAYTEPPNAPSTSTFNGLAAWSGTSFSTPVVTGLVAAQMSAAKQSPIDAYNAVIGGATSAVDPRAGAIKVVGPLS